MKVGGTVATPTTLLFVGAFTVLALAVLVFGPGSAFAARETDELSGSFTGTGTSKFVRPTGVAVDNSTGLSSGDVWVLDPEASRVEKFDGAGNFLLMIGKGVDVTTGGDICPVASTDECGPGTFGSVPGGFSSPSYIGVDSSTGPSKGDVYISDGNGYVQKFEPDGALVTSWGTDGALTAGASAGFGPISGITVTPGGTLVVTNYYSEVFEFAEDGTPSGYYVAPNGSNSGGIAADGDGHLFKMNSGEPSTYEKFSAGTGADVGTVNLSSLGGNVAYDPVHEDLYTANHQTVDRAHFTGDTTVLEGHFPCTFKPGAGCGPTDTFGEGVLSAAGGIGVNWSTGVVYVADGEGGVDKVDIFTPVVLPEARTEAPTELTQFSVRLEGTVDSAGGPALTNCHFELGTTTAYGTNLPCEPGGGLTGEVPISALAALSPETTYHYRLVASSGGVTYRSLDKVVIGGPPAVPTVESTTASAIEPTAATLSSTIDPGGAPLTYRFEYGPTPEYGTRTYPGGPLQPAGDGTVTAGVQIGGLTPGVTYYFRVMATNFSGTVFGPEQTFTTSGGGAISTSVPAVAVATAPAAATPAPAAPTKCRKGFALKKGKCVKQTKKKKKNGKKHKPVHARGGKKR
jgi:hypothetical protein